MAIYIWGLPNKPEKKILNTTGNNKKKEQKNNPIV